MRLFFALDLPDRSKLDLHSWQEKAFSIPQASVPVENLHLTLAFLGDCPDYSLEVIEDAAHKVETESFSLLLDQPGFFTKQEILWLGLSEQNPALEKLFFELRKQLILSGIRVDDRTFVPHISLWRKVSPRYAQALPIIPPRFELFIDNFSLFESITKNSNRKFNARESTSVSYRKISSWKLNPRLLGR